MLNSTMIRKMFENMDELPAKLTELGLVPAEGDYKCPTCATSLKLHKDSSRGDGFRWVCTGRISKNKQVKKCVTRVEFRKHTFFEGTVTVFLSQRFFIRRR